MYNYIINVLIKHIIRKYNIITQTYIRNNIRLSIFKVNSRLYALILQDFHEMSHGLLLWLENIDRRRNEIVPINHNQDSDTLQEHHKTLSVCVLLVHRFLSAHY